MTTPTPASSAMAMKLASNAMDSLQWRADPKSPVAAVDQQHFTSLALALDIDRAFAPTLDFNRRARAAMQEEIESHRCNNCSGVGYTFEPIHVCGGDLERCARMCPQPEQSQCEFCCTVPTSRFNALNKLRALLAEEQGT